ncbi:MAG: acyl carrier protein [Candidatus Promineifilaceae bacterium]
MDVSQTVERFIIDELLLGDREHIAADESLLASGVIDSVSLLRLIAFLEEELGVQIEDDEVVLENFETLTDITNFVSSKTKAAS